MGPLRLRPATPEDYAAFVRFFAELGVPDPVPDSASWTHRMLPTTGFLEQNGNPVGYAFWEPQPPLGYVRHVVIASERRGQGFGYTLMAALKHELLARKCTRWCLNVKVSNTSARRLYHGVGMTDQHLSRVLRLPWASVAKLPRSPSVATAPVSPDDDPHVEQRFALPPGTLAIRRRRPASVVIAATDPSDAEGPAPHGGLAVFDPDFPGAFPFRASAPSTARALLELLHQYRRPEHLEVQLVIEADAELSAALVHAGARPLFELVHMAGDIE